MKKVCGFFLLSIMMTGCTAVHKGIKYSDLDVQTKMSQTIFLDPYLAGQKFIYLEIRNTSGKQNLDITQMLRASLEAKGYKVVSHPEEGTMVIQINILSVGRVREEEAFFALGSGFGGVLQGAGIGALVGGLASESYTGFGTGAFVGGAVGAVSDALVEVMTYNLITDVQITQKPQGQGSSVDKKVYQTRIISMARRVNLGFGDAVPPLQQGLVSSLSGMLP